MHRAVVGPVERGCGGWQCAAAFSRTKLPGACTIMHPKMMPMTASRTVHTQSKRGRPRKSEPEESPVTPEPEPAPSPAPAVAKKRKSRTTKAESVLLAQKVPDVPAHDIISTSDADTRKTSSKQPKALAAVEATPEAAPVFEEATTQEWQDFRLEAQTQAEVQGSAPATGGTAGRPEESDGSYGIQLGLSDDSYEKATLREEVGYDLYKLRQNMLDSQLPEDQLPRQFRTRTGSAREVAQLQFAMTRDYWQKRQAEQDYVHDLGFRGHHRSREKAVNIYANTRRVAGLMTAFENDDFKLQNRAPTSIAAWARAEIVFKTEHDDFNAMLKDSMENLVKRMPKEAQEEELDLLDEALFLLRPDDDNAAADRAGQQTAEQELLDTYLEGVLPGATLDNLAATYADDIFAEGDAYEDAVDTYTARTTAAAATAAAALAAVDLGAKAALAKDEEAAPAAESS